MAYEHAAALTGGIATGKSTAAGIFRKMGFPVIDADTIAHEVLEQEREAVARIFGPRVIAADGRVDRPALGAIVFADAERRRELEGLLHPKIEARIVQEAAALDALERPYLIDIPLFYEREAYPIERVIVVYAPRALQLRRLMARNGLSETEALRRIEAQMDIETKRRRATWVIDNTRDLPHLHAECERVAAAMV